MERYSVIREKDPREIVLLRGSGCRWKKCTFCDYHLDRSSDAAANFALNSEVLDRVTGVYHRLEVINSGSFCELDPDTLNRIAELCVEKQINRLYFESHYMYRQQALKAKEAFQEKGIELKIKTGVETFDIQYRENVMKKGFGIATPTEIAEYADQVCLLFGLKGQTETSMLLDIQTGLTYFDRICINIMNSNSTPVEPDPEVIRCFAEKLAPIYYSDKRVDILMDNLEFGIGTKVQEAL